MAWDAEGVSRALNTRTQMIIDAFPRSANSFATVAFQHCQNREVAVAHHYHAAATILFGARRSIPTLTLIRNPDDACLSHAVFTQSASIDGAFREYVNFYKPIEHLRGDIVVARFDTVVENFGVVIDRVNDVFGTDFNTFAHTPENVSEVRQILSARTSRRFGDEGIRKGHGETPTAAKDALKAKMKSMLFEERLQGIRKEAHRLYDYFDRNADV